MDMDLWWYVVVYGAVALAVLVTILAVVKVYNKATCGQCHSYRSLRGKTVLVTGANRGIGKEVALDMAMRGAKVILACRNLKEGQKTVEEIVKRTGNKKVGVRQVDVASLASVRKVAEELNKRESRLDILVHNAGVGGIRPRTMTVDNLELTFVTNCLGPFLMTTLLLGLLKKSAPASIIFLSSVSHFFGKIEMDNLNGEKNYNHILSYANSKLAVLLYTKELAKRLVGTNVKVNCVHPGLVDTNLYRHLVFPLRWIIRCFIKVFCKSSKEGAQPVIYLAVSKEVENVSGKYFADCKVAKESVKASDMVVAKQLWEASERMVTTAP